MPCQLIAKMRAVRTPEPPPPPATSLQILLILYNLFAHVFIYVYLFSFHFFIWVKLKSSLLTLGPIYMDFFCNLLFYVYITYYCKCHFSA